MFAKFMNKKFFHPGSYPNIKRRWMAEQRTLAKEKKEQEMRETYEKEQQNYQHKMLLAKKDEDKIKLGLNFMYDLPPGMKKDGENDGAGKDEEEVKFEWQKNAPRAKYAKKLGLDVHDQPFGVCVRNVKCFKCGKWGHQNVDKECPKFNENNSESKSALNSLCLSDPLRLISDMRREHGLTLRKSVIGTEIDPMAENQQILDSDDEMEDPEAEIEYINSLSDKQKRKLLRKLEKLERKKNKRLKTKDSNLAKMGKKSRKRKVSTCKSSSEDEWEESNAGKSLKEEHFTSAGQDVVKKSHNGERKRRNQRDKEMELTQLSANRESKSKKRKITKTKH